MNKTSIAFSLLLVAAAATLGTSWYTGTQLEDVLQASIERSNQQLQTAAPGMTISLELLGLERAVFSSDARYQLRVGDTQDGEVRTFVISDHIQHGPFPFSRLKALKFWPVMATSHFRLEDSDDVRAWFASTEGQSPLQGESSIGYDQGVSGQLRMAPLDAVMEGHALTTSGLQAEFESSGAGERLKFAAQMERFDLKISGQRPGHVELHGLTVLADRTLGRSGLYLGDSRLVLQSARVALQDTPALAFSDLVQTDSLREQGGQVAGNFNFELGMLSVNQQPLGSSRLDWSMQNLDAEALKSLGELYAAYAVQVQPEGQQPGRSELSEEQRSQLETAVDRLLAGAPRLALDELSLKTANGEGRLGLQLSLAKPESYELPPQQLINQLITSLNARLQVAKPLISDLMLFQAALQPGADLAAAAQEAKMTAEMSGEIVTAIRLGRVEGENILSDFSYADGQVVLNGQSMPVEQFIGLLMALGQMAAAGDMSPAPLQQ